MQNITKRLHGFKILIYSDETNGTLEISRHKIIILLLYISSFLFTFFHFAFIPKEVKLEVINAITEGNEPQISLSVFMVFTLICYTYITVMAIYSSFSNGLLPKKLFINPMKFKRRYKILFLFLLFFFLGGIIIILAFISLFMIFLSFIIGYYMFIIWMILEPFFLFGGVLAIINIITNDHNLFGYSKHSKLSLVGIFISASISLSFFFIKLSEINKTQDSFIDIGVPLFGLDIISIYLPAIESFRNTLSSLLGITIIFIVIWYLKDRLIGFNIIREQKKGILPIFLVLTLLFTSLKIIPIIFSTKGNLQEITNILDIMGLFTAIILGLWQIIDLEQEHNPMKIKEKFNPIKLVKQLHPYSKTLFLFILSMFAFFASLNASTIAFITNSPNNLQLQELNLLAGLLGVAFIYNLWHYKGRIAKT